jgi:23S rRNA (pseudouridine1915-N3)-methyltransferase
LRILVAAVGRLKAGPERDLVARYLDRTTASGRSLALGPVDVVEIAESRARRPEDRKREEAVALRAALGTAAFVALDEHGKSPTSQDFADRLAALRDEGVAQLGFVIGGADGLDEAFLLESRWRIAFGAMTWPHQIVRLLLAEQLYRASTILSGHPYHRS